MSQQTDFWEPVWAFGADLQRGFNTVAPYISPLYGGIIGLTGGYGETFGEIAENINTGETPAHELAKNVSDAWESTLHWGYETQKNVQWVVGGFAEAAQGVHEFLETGGSFIDRLTGGQGLLGQIGAIAPIAVIGLIAVAVLIKK